ncbi:MAG TPA: D-2-hydroxyacid dehydrogenase [Terriglobales bacterium]|nr:D-2-hydroxyacid dehydrogenase [Terriglobales bacterium]
MKLLLVHPHRFPLWNSPTWVGDRLGAEFPNVEVVQLLNYDRMPEEMAGAEIFIGASLRPEQFQQARKLRWIHSPSTGVQQFMFPEIIASDVILTNGRTIHGRGVAEHSLALMLALAKRLPSAFRYQQQRIWGQGAMCEESPMPRELADATLLLLGAGSIGREVIPRAKAFGMKIIVIRENVGRGAEGADQVHSMDDLDRLLPLADFVLITLPTTPNTKTIFNRERLSRMKPEAYLLNVSRGALIDETALFECLQKKQIGGAALDVLTTEPLPAESPLWSLENLLITPHTAALARNLWERHYALIADNLRRYLAGEPLRNMVDKQKGY